MQTLKVEQRLLQAGLLQAHLRPVHVLNVETTRHGQHWTLPSAVELRGQDKENLDGVGQTEFSPPLGQRGADDVQRFLHAGFGVAVVVDLPELRRLAGRTAPLERRRVESGLGDAFRRLTQLQLCATTQTAANGSH